MMLNLLADSHATMIIFQVSIFLQKSSSGLARDDDYLPGVYFFAKQQVTSLCSNVSRMKKAQFDHVRNCLEMVRDQ